MMNVPPPANTLKIKVESGDPVVVRFDHKGQKYVARISIAIPAVWPTGTIGPDGLPQFNVQIAPIIMVAKEGVTS
jgi:hypothetical protein